ncbi:MAG: DNA topoisomerase (ATP-hydrolyzing) subunit A [Candidatus Thorarchaeota archaeon]
MSQEEINFNGDYPIKEIHEELSASYLEYAMSTIVSRALPDIRDGLKPVQRRILWTMWRNGYTHDKEFRKCAKTVGAVIADFHPHGDASVYAALVRLSQRFSMRYPLIDFHGNNGSANGEPPAAHRYTESRLAELAESMLEETEFETIDMKPNFDGEYEEPAYTLPSPLPNLLLNGSQGIAVAVSTNIPPHNLNEIVLATKHVLHYRNCTLDDVLKYIKGPDFPSGAIITNTPSEIKEMYETGHGSIIQRAKVEIEERTNGAFNLVVSELPWQVKRKDDDKHGVVADIERMIIDKKIPQITEIIDGSEGESVKIVIKLKPGSRPKEILELLYNTTQLESRFPVYMMALNSDPSGKLIPKEYNLINMLRDWIDFRIDVIKKKHIFLKRKAEEKLHLRRGRLIIVHHLDRVIEIIKTSSTPKDAQRQLEQEFNLDELQSEDVLNRPLRSLTNLDRDNLLKEVESLESEIAGYTEILSSESKIIDIIDNELDKLMKKYGDNRKSQIIPREITISNFSTNVWTRSVPAEVEEKTLALTLSFRAYLKCTSMENYRVQHRGGVGVSSMTLKDEDFVKLFLTVSSYDYLLFFTSKGKLFVIPAYDIPVVSRTAKGTPITAYLNLATEESEEIDLILSISSLDQGSLFFVTQKGIVKTTDLNKFSNVRANGIKAITLDEDDKLISVGTVQDHDLIVISTKKGKANLFDESEVRSMGRSARGVRGIKLREDDEVVSAAVIPMNIPQNEEIKKDEIKGFQEQRCETVELLTVSENGLGKRSLLSYYRKTKRGSQGVINMAIDEKTGNVVAVHLVELIQQVDQTANEEYMDCDENLQLITVSTLGMLTRMPVHQIRRVSRNTKGVKVMNLKEGEKLVSSHLTLGEE